MTSWAGADDSRGEDRAGRVLGGPGPGDLLGPFAGHQSKPSRLPPPLCGQCSAVQEHHRDEDDRLNHPASPCELADGSEKNLTAPATMRALTSRGNNETRLSATRRLAGYRYSIRTSSQFPRLCCLFCVASAA